MRQSPGPFSSEFPDGRVLHEVSLAELTTFRCGGRAEWYIEARTSGEVVRAVRAARSAGLPITVLGGGSNVLVGDGGIEGLAVRPVMAHVHEERPGTVRADAGVALNGLVRWTISRGLGGLEAWAGTPGKVGGAIAGNAHYGGRLIGGLVARASVVTEDGKVAIVQASEMEFGYDRSRLQRTGEILLCADFELRPGSDPSALRAVARQSLADRKRTQPLGRASAGCVFRNPDPRAEPVPEGVPASAGALIDRAGLKGRSIGGARVSEVHANFIVNTGGATSADVRALIDLCRLEVRKAFGITLREEIHYLGKF